MTKVNVAELHVCCCLLQSKFLVRREKVAAHSKNLEIVLVDPQNALRQQLHIVSARSPHDCFKRSVMGSLRKCQDKRVSRSHFLVTKVANIRLRLRGRGETYAA